MRQRRRLLKNMNLIINKNISLILALKIKHRDLEVKTRKLLRMELKQNYPRYYQAKAQLIQLSLQQFEKPQSLSARSL